MTSHEYWSEVAELAKTTWEDSREDDQDLHERLHENVDGHQWVIYTAYNFDVLKFSDNDGYTIENFGAESAMQDGVLNTAALAFGALYGDVAEYIGNHEAEWEDEAEAA